jgi:cytochrome c556
LPDQMLSVSSVCRFGGDQMRASLAAMILVVSLQAGAAVAAASPDRCAAREQAFRTEAESACSGLSYLFNPSGCFIARKALAAFDVATCRANAAPEQMPTGPPEPIAAAVPPLRSDLQEKAPCQAAAPKPDVEQLQAEIARLKAEIARLKGEMEQLRGKDY